MIIRKYKPSDCAAMAKMFYDTVHTISSRDYIKEQLNVWAKGSADLEEWDISFLNHNTLIAEINGEIVGFADMDNSGYLDKLYVHKNFQRRGIATALVDELERCAKEICTWKYDKEYSVYNSSDWDVVVEKGWDLGIKERENLISLQYYHMIN